MTDHLLGMLYLGQEGCCPEILEPQIRRQQRYKKSSFSKGSSGRVEETAQQLRTLAALPEDLAPMEQLTTICDPSARVPITLLWTPRALHTCDAQAYMQANTNKINDNFKNRQTGWRM